MSDPIDEQRDDYDDHRPQKPVERHFDKPLIYVKPLNRRGLGFGIALLCTIFVVCLGGLFLGSFSVRDTAERMKSSSSLSQMGVAIQNFDGAYGELPNNSYDAKGKPLLSWRVHILPFIEQEALYKRFNLDEPWDSPINLPLLKEMPAIYAHPADRGGNRGTVTYYRGFSNPGAVFERRPAIPYWRPMFFGPIGVPPHLIEKRQPRFAIDNFKDLTSETIMVVEAGDPVEWTKPDDLDASPGKPFPPVGGFRSRSGEFQAMMGDGRYRKFKMDTSEELLRALVTHSGGESVTMP